MLSGEQRLHRTTVSSAAIRQARFHEGRRPEEEGGGPKSSNQGQKTSRDTRAFDLNVEKILENWETYHAVREIIANAICEEVLSATKPLRVFHQEGDWHRRDYRRGLHCEYLTRNEND